MLRHKRVPNLYLPRLIKLGFVKRHWPVLENRKEFISTEFFDFLASTELETSPNYAADHF